MHLLKNFRLIKLRKFYKQAAILTLGASSCHVPQGRYIMISLFTLNKREKKGGGRKASSDSLIVFFLCSYAD